MDVNTKFGYFVENLGNPFMVGSLITNKTFYINKQATELFGITTEDCDLGKVFDKTPERVQSLMVKALKQSKPTLVYNYTAITKDNKKILVDLQVGYFNDEKTEVFLEIIPQIDKRFDLALHQIQNSPRAEAILNFDENLSIVDCNEAFLKVFGASEELRHSHFKNDLVNGFLPELRESLVADIHKTLKIGDIFSTELKVFTANGEEHWYRFDLQKRELDNSGTKLMCYMVNIEKEVKRKEENDLLNQYLSIMQESSTDILYRVDINENTMYHYSDFITVGGKGRAIVDYVSVFMSGEIIHPDDRETYIEGFKSFYDEDVTLNAPIRFSFDGGEYRWYRIAAKKIFNAKGELVEVFGALLNVDNEVHMQEEVSAMHKYFDVLNEITDESLYIYDIKTDKLRLGGLTEKELGLPTEVENFPNSVIEWVHPDDLDKFMKFDGSTLITEKNSLEVRLKNVDGQYQWYELLSDIICDDNGNQTEIFGRIKNIQSKHKLETEMEEANNYLLVMQELSDDILYHIDVDAKTLVYTTKSKSGEIITNTFENYPQSTFDKNLMHPDDEKIILEQTDQWLSGNMVKYKIRMKLVTDDYEWYEDSAFNIRDKEGKVTEIYGRLQNIHAAETMEAEVSTLNQYVEAAQSLSGESLFYVDRKTLILRQKGDVAVELGLSEEIMNYPEGAYTFIHAEDLENYKIYANDTMNGKTSSVQCKVRTATGEYQWYEIVSKPIYNNMGEFVEIFGRMTNIQDKKDLEQKATHDLMTKVLNKVSFEEESEDIMLKLRPDKKHALIFIDLDDFKGVNDKLGHSYGDILLTTVGKRLKRHVREGDLVGRIGGDEFAVMLCNIGDEQSVLDRTNIMLESVKRNFSHEGISVGIKASVGVAVYPQHGTTYKDLIGKADLGVYESKRRGKNVVSMYSEEVEEY